MSSLIRELAVVLAVLAGFIFVFAPTLAKGWVVQ